MYTAKFDHERHREQLQPRFHLESFCKSEGVDTDYLGYKISDSIHKNFPLHRLSIKGRAILISISLAFFKLSKYRSPTEV